jgi:hypothetical protein
MRAAGESVTPDAVAARMPLTCDDLMRAVLWAFGCAAAQAIADDGE